jgi:hypothetical protein
MLEGMLLMLLALGGGNTGSASASVASAATAEPVVGVWRGTWETPGADKPVPVEAIVSAPSKEGRLVAVFATGTGRAKRATRVTGRLEPDGARFALPGGGTLRLAAASASRLIGVVRGVGTQSPTPGDGTLELARVRR